MPACKTRRRGYALAFCLLALCASLGRSLPGAAGGRQRFPVSPLPLPAPSWPGGPREARSQYQCGYNDFMAMLESQISIANATALLHAHQSDALAEGNRGPSAPPADAQFSAYGDVSGNRDAPAACLSLLAAAINVQLPSGMGCELGAVWRQTVELARALMALPMLLPTCDGEAFIKTYRTMHALFEANSTEIAPEAVVRLTRHNFRLQHMLANKGGARIVSWLAMAPDCTACTRVGRGVLLRTAADHAVWASMRHNRALYSAQIAKPRVLQRWQSLATAWRNVQHRVHEEALERAKKKKSRKKSTKKSDKRNERVAGLPIS